MTAQPQKVLLINHQPASPDPLADYLKIDSDRYHLILAGNSHEALEILNREKVSLVLYDSFVPDSSEIDVKTEIQTRWPRMKTLSTAVFESGQRNEERSGADESDSVNPSFRFEPIRQKILKKIVEKEEGFEGTLKNFQLSDLIQMCCLSGVSTAIRVCQDSQEGFLFIKNGEIIHALYNEVIGEEAFYHILSWKRGSFETCSLHPFPEPTIEKNWEFLIMEGTRMSDEQTTADPRQEKQDPVDSGPFPQEQIRVLIVDDSPLMCRILEEILATDGAIKVIGVAHNGEEALEKIDLLKPNLITLDVNMPVMDGGTALRHIMIKNPCPIVIVSRLGSKPSATILEFLRLGAVDFILKPRQGADLSDQQKHLIEKIKQAAKAKTGNFKRVKVPRIHPGAQGSLGAFTPCERLVVVASGGGGYAELIRMLPLLPADINACLLVLQDTSPELLPPLSDYLCTISGLAVRPLRHQAPFLNGCCYIGADGVPAKVVSEDGKYFFQLEDALSRDSFSRKPFDALLCSIADTFTGQVLVVLLSGAEIGDLEGLRSIKERNGQIIAQQLDSCLLPYSLEKAIQAQVVDLDGTHDEIARQMVQGVGNGKGRPLHPVSGME